MAHDAEMGRSAVRPERKVLAVRFSSAPGGSNRSDARVHSVWRLLPRSWRRRVVIRGRHFWLPG